MSSASAEQLRQMLEAKKKKLWDAEGSPHKVKEKKPSVGSSLLSRVKQVFKPVAGRAKNGGRTDEQVTEALGEDRPEEELRVGTRPREGAFSIAPPRQSGEAERSANSAWTHEDGRSFSNSNQREDCDHQPTHLDSALSGTTTRRRSALKLSSSFSSITARGKDWGSGPAETQYRAEEINEVSEHHQEPLESSKLTAANSASLDRESKRQKLGQGKRQEQAEEQDQDPGQGQEQGQAQRQAEVLNANLLTSPSTASRMDRAQFSTYMAALGESFDSESYWVSIPLRHLLLRAPLEVTRSSIKQWKFAFEHSPIQAEDSYNDIFPLPLMLSDEDLRWDMAAADPSSSARRSLRQLPVNMGRECQARDVIVASERAMQLELWHSGAKTRSRCFGQVQMLQSKQRRLCHRPQQTSRSCWNKSWHCSTTC